MSHSIRIRDNSNRSYLLTETGMVETGKSTQFIVLRFDLKLAISTIEQSFMAVGIDPYVEVIAYSYDLRRSYHLQLRPSGAVRIGCRRFNRATGRLLSRWATYGVNGSRGVGNRK